MSEQKTVDQVQVLEEVMQRPGVVRLKDGREVITHKCKLKQIAHVAGYVQKVGLLALGNETVATSLAVAKGDIQTLLTDIPFVTQIILALSDDTYALLSDFCSITKDEFADLELDDGIAVVSSIVGENLDFFVQKVLPMVINAVNAQAENLEKMAAGGLKGSLASLSS